MKTIEISNADKIMFPKSQITKGDLVEYYEKIAEHMLPYLKDRPLTLHRFPEGISNDGFFQKNASDYFPDWIRTVKLKKKDGWVNHVICDIPETLIYLVNHSTITFHVALGKVDKPDHPDKLIFDLDPTTEDFRTVVEGAKTIRDLLETTFKLATFVMTTGSKGLHIAVPLDRTENFDEVRDFAKNVAKYLCNEYPKKYTTSMRKDQRGGRLFIDYIRNSYGQTAVCPFSARAIEGAPVATPLSWEELEDKCLDAQNYTIQNIFDRLKKKEDPWTSFEKKGKSIESAKKKLGVLMERYIEEEAE